MNSKIIISVIALFTFTSTILVGLGFFLTISVSSTYALLTGIISIAVVLWISHKKQIDKCSVILSMIVSILILFFCIIFASISYEGTSDGRGFHQPSVILMMQGWNPVYDKNLSEFKDFYGQFNMAHMSDNAKGSYLTSATVAKCLDNVSAGGYTRPAYLILSFLIVMVVLGEITSLPVPLRLFLSLSFALNPICLYQILSGTVDGIGASLALICLFSWIGYVYTRQYFYIVVSLMMVPLFLTVKISMPIYCLLLFFAVVTTTIACCKGSKKVYRTLMVSFVSGCLIAAIIGFNPYVINLIKHYNPIYPILSSKSPGTNMPAIVNKGLENDDRFTQFYKSQLTDQVNYKETGRNLFNYAISFPQKEVKGLGNWFGIIFVFFTFYVIFHQR